MIIEVPAYDPDQLPDDSNPNGLIYNQSRVSLAPGLSVAIHGA
jgi:hypothetical protein